ncbi:hypothetical protein BRADI_2g49168v3 [Brachypodium distachyon]|uniref:Uncharacterized protein n=1 Tax=Brachypodium distachyon TaxID=15368 RepID=A0A2K2DER7_BRADI|nr:hypothetical protein BRADI_2g49168v3 [Brachypodium distachyon]
MRVHPKFHASSSSSTSSDSSPREDPQIPDSLFPVRTRGTGSNPHLLRAAAAWGHGRGRAAPDRRREREMGKIEYVVVARGAVVLVEHNGAGVATNAGAVARQTLERTLAE